MNHAIHLTGTLTATTLATTLATMLALAPATALAQSGPPAAPNPPTGASPAASASSASSANSASPVRPRRIRAGLLLGAHFADFGGSERQRLLAEVPDFGLETRERVAVGGFLTISIRPKWSLRVEALVAMKGARSNDALPFLADDPNDPLCMTDPPDPGCSTTQFAAQYNIDHVLRYLEVPILAQYDIYYDGAITPYVFAGPAVRLLWATAVDGDGQIVDATGRTTGTLTASSNLDDVSETLDIAVMAGAGIEFPLRRGALVITARYEVGLLQAIDGEFTLLLDMEGEPPIPLSVVPLEAKSLRNRGFSLMAGYRF